MAAIAPQCAQKQIPWLLVALGAKPRHVSVFFLESCCEFLFVCGLCGMPRLVVSHEGNKCDFVGNVWGLFYK